MRTNFLVPIVAICAAAACQTATAAAPALSAEAPAATPTASPLELGRDLTARFYAGETALIWSQLNDQMRSGFGSEQSIDGFRQQVDAQLGSETEVIDEQVTAQPPYQVYLRTASFSKFDQPVLVQWAIGADGKIAGFFVKPK